MKNTKTNQQKKTNEAKVTHIGTMNEEFHQQIAFCWFIVCISYGMRTEKKIIYWYVFNPLRALHTRRWFSRVFAIAAEFCFIFCFLLTRTQSRMWKIVQIGIIFVPVPHALPPLNMDKYRSAIIAPYQFFATRPIDNTQQFNQIHGEKDKERAKERAIVY